MAVGRSAMSTRSASLAPSPKEPKRSRASRQGIWFGLLSQLAPNKVLTWGEYWCGLVDRLTSERNKAGCRAPAIGFAPRFIAAMATAIKREYHMYRRTPTRRPRKESAIPPPHRITGSSWRRFGEKH